MKTAVSTKWLVVVLFLCFGHALSATETAQIIYVDDDAAGADDGSSWADAYPYLQDALTEAALRSEPVEIRVAQGVYQPDLGVGITPGDRLATFQLLDGVTLKGGYAGTTGSDPDARDVQAYETILSGDLAGDGDSNDVAFGENSHHVVTANGTEATAVIDGFTITGGSIWRDALESPLIVPGEAILVRWGSPVIRDCSFAGNDGWYAVWATDKSDPVVTNCVFLDQDTGGMLCTNNSNAVLTGCRFEVGSRDALPRGALHIDGSSPTLTDCTFACIGRGTIDASDCNSVFANCVFTGSGASPTELGIRFSSGRLTLTGCTFTGLEGGAIDAKGGDLTLVRCTFTNNGGGFVSAPVAYIMGSGSLTAVRVLLLVITARRLERSGATTCNYTTASSPAIQDMGPVPYHNSRDAF